MKLRGWNSYMVCGAIGYAAGLVLAMALAGLCALALPARIAIATVPPLVLVAGAHLAHVLSGRRRLVFYEQAIAAIVLTTAVAAVTGAAWRITADVVTLGVGTFLAFGRIGCYRVGCCHGRPWRHGVRYRDEHVDSGFDPALRGVPLLPVQLLDAGLAAGASVLGACVVSPGAPGRAVAAWFACYGVGRFALELLRADRRPHVAGASEAQWIAMATTAGAAVLWPHALVLAAAASVAAATLALAVAWRLRVPARFWLTRFEHLRELQAFIARAPGGTFTVTSCGLELSVHRVEGGILDVVARPPDARALPEITQHLARSWQIIDVVMGQQPGIVHLLMR